MKIRVCYYLAIVFCIVGMYANTEDVLNPLVHRTKKILKNKRKDTVPVTLGIAGCSGVGKSYCAHKLASMFEKQNIKAVVLKFDDFLDPNHKDPLHFHPRFKYQDGHKTMQSIFKGEKIISKPTWNTQRRTKKDPAKIIEHFSIQGADVVICEGEFTLCSDEPYNFRSYMNLGIFVDASDDDIAEWDWYRGKTDKTRAIKEKNKARFIRKKRSELKKYRDYVEPVRYDTSYLLLKNKNHTYTLFEKLSK